jgi:hypothetical protein
MLRFRGFVEQARDRTYRAGSAFGNLGDGPHTATALLGKLTSSISGCRTGVLIIDR